MLFYYFGMRDQFVDSQRYAAMADYVVTHGSLEYGYQIFYALPICLLAVCQLLFSDATMGYVLIQSGLSMVGAWCMYRAACKTFNGARAGLCCAIIFLMWLDCMQWNTAVMTESLAGTLICSVLLAVARYEGKLAQLLGLLLLSVACVLTRPTGVLIVASIAVFLLSYYWPYLSARPRLRLSVLLSLALAFAVGAYLMLNSWDFTDQYVRGNIVTYIDVIEGQQFYDEGLRLDVSEIRMPDPDRPAAQKVFLFAIENPLHFAEAAAWKVFYVVTFYRPYYSASHNIYTFIWLAVVYTCAYAGFKLVKNRALRHFCLSTIFLTCLLVAVTAADWDNRFYMPMQPAIAFLAGGGLAFILWSGVPRITSSSFR